ncbi:hypothetical protein [Bdellovibrio sp. BCCA]|uniref:hypothetical protein n=1 Tax=Bdellovibrio sp. BCCA TaxID=3136281 RepID=UPI0030EFEB3D
MTKKLRILPVLLGLEIIYLCIAILIPTLPGWKMFASFQRVSYVAKSVDNSEDISLEKYLPPTYYTLTEPMLVKLARFACEKEQKSISLNITNKESKVYVFKTPTCDLQ